MTGVVLTKPFARTPTLVCVNSGWRLHFGASLRLYYVAWPSKNLIFAYEHRTWLIAEHPFSRFGTGNKETLIDGPKAVPMVLESNGYGVRK